ncbi:MAG: hypothetical protein ACREKM_05365, partial [Longimicrobiales bacterium]
MRHRAIAAFLAVLAGASASHAQQVPVWRLSAGPTLRIGVATGGTSPEQFFRLNSATLLPDGGVLALNAGTYEL